MPAIKPSTAHEVRAKFFNRIGIETTRKKNPLDNHVNNVNKNVNNNVNSNNNKTTSINNSLLVVAEKAGTKRSMECAQAQWSHPRTRLVNKTQELLKYNAVDDRLFSSSGVKKQRTGFATKSSKASVTTTTKTTASATTTCQQKTRKPNRRISFHNIVQVVPIPMRSEYSNRIRHRLWSSSLEIQQNAMRNAIEFASEGWNWRSVIDDDGMYVCNVTGEMIHPIHYENAGVAPGEFIP